MLRILWTITLAPAGRRHGVYESGPTDGNAGSAPGTERARALSDRNLQELKMTPSNLFTSRGKGSIETRVSLPQKPEACRRCGGMGAIACRYCDGTGTSPYLRLVLGTSEICVACYGLGRRDCLTCVPADGRTRTHRTSQSMCTPVVAA